MGSYGIVWVKIKDVSPRALWPTILEQADKVGVNSSFLKEVFNRKIFATVYWLIHDGTLFDLLRTSLSNLTWDINLVVVRVYRDFKIPRLCTGEALTVPGTKQFQSRSVRMFDSWIYMKCLLAWWCYFPTRTEACKIRRGWIWDGVGCVQWCRLKDCFVLHWTWSELSRSSSHSRYPETSGYFFWELQRTGCWRRRFRELAYSAFPPGRPRLGCTHPRAAPPKHCDLFSS